MAAKKRLPRRQPPKSSSASRVPQPLTSDALVYTEYEITDEPLDNRDVKKLPAQVQERIDELYELAHHDPAPVIPELERLIATYPHIPTFANYHREAPFQRDNHSTLHPVECCPSPGLSSPGYLPVYWVHGHQRVALREQHLT